MLLLRATSPTSGRRRGSGSERIARAEAGPGPCPFHLGACGRTLTKIAASCHDRREVLALAAVLSRLAAALPARPLPRSPTMDDLLDGTHLQVVAASWALSHCAMLGGKLDLQGSQAFRVAAAAQLVLQAAPWSLAVGRAAVEHYGQQEAEHLGVSAHLAECCAAFATAMATASDILLLPPAQRDAAAAFASSTARPDALLPWLREMAPTLLMLPSEFADDPGKSVCLTRARRIGVAAFCLQPAEAPWVRGCRAPLLRSAIPPLPPLGACISQLCSVQAVVPPATLHACHPYCFPPAVRCGCRCDAPYAPGAALVWSHC